MSMCRDFLLLLNRHLRCYVGSDECAFYDIVPICSRVVLKLLRIPDSYTGICLVQPHFLIVFMYQPHFLVLFLGNRPILVRETEFRAGRVPAIEATGCIYASLLVEYR